MTMPQFVPARDTSHDWQRFDASEAPENVFCGRCEICTCHSPVASREPCEFAVHHSKVSGEGSEDER